MVKIFPMKKRTKSIPSSEISQPQTFEPINAIAPIQSLIPVQNIKNHFNTKEQTYTFDEVIKMAGIVLSERK